MSIMVCESCCTYIDTDFFPMNVVYGENKDKYLCDICYEEEVGFDNEDEARRDSE